ncbi:GDSL-type esterase/lipase family protein [uncultured Brachyspira sp.]|uniref:GDSL-type esterase/lipase family protein n=1 Tax=uncultured Brachyspira sp. TaxID=221953 RepID=UPI002632C29F|nr:GDSL-type esterase/lipase family protein [uncultured Brachyspira sp.]
MRNVVCLGDSTTYGYMISRKKVWPSILNNKFAEDSKEINIINKGINGDTTSGMIARFERDCLNENADLLILMGGVNDIFMFQNIDKIKNNIKLIVDISNKNNVDIILFTPIPFIKEIFTFFEADNLDGFENTLKEYVSWINEYTKENNIKSIDVYNMFMNNIFKSNKYEDIYFDGVHLSENGHNVFALELYKELGKYL